MQVTHMPDLEEAIMNSVNNGRSSSSSSNNGSEEGSSLSGSNGASRPSSPSHQPDRNTSHQPDRNRAAELAAMEQSIEGGLPRPQPMSAGLAGKAAQGFGNEAYKSTDIL